MKDVLKIGDTLAKPGEAVKGSLGSVEIADGSKVTIPVININGANDGPVLTVVSGVHGPEISPIGAVLAAVRKVDPTVLRGALLCIPGANPLAFRNASYTTPIDSVNLSGPWFLPPPDPVTATITQRMACHISEALEIGDYALDMHANPLPSMPFVLTNYEMCPDKTVEAETRKIAEAFGVTIINNPRKQASSLRDLCVRRGKPALTPELAGNIYMWDSISEVGTRGILNVMKAIGMLDGEMEKQEVTVLTGDMTAYGRLICQRGGFMYVKKAPGEKIAKGETVIEIVNVYGDVVEEIFMPVDGYCWSFTGGFCGTHAVSEGSKLAYVFAEREAFGEKSIYVEKNA